MRSVNLRAGVMHRADGGVPAPVWVCSCRERTDHEPCSKRPIDCDLRSHSIPAV